MAALIQFASGAPGIKYTLDKPEILIGRQAGGNDICLPCSYVSKRHARIEVVTDQGEGFTFYLEDLGSTNQTFVNDEPITRVRLQHHDVIRIGRNTLKFDAHCETAMLEALVVSAAKPLTKAGAEDSRTWHFSRRLRLFGIDA